MFESQGDIRAVRKMIRLTEAEARVLEVEARRRGFRDSSKLIREAVRTYLAKGETNGKRPSRRGRVPAAG